MAEALILDAEAVNALAYPSKRAALARRASAILRLAYERRALVRIPAPVLAEVCRGTKQDAPVNLLLSNPGGNTSPSTVWTRARISNWRGYAS
jgi:hypothetical protein